MRVGRLRRALALRCGASARLSLCLILWISAGLVGACAGEPPGKAGDHAYSIRVGERDRHYRVHVPPAYSQSSPAPVVLVFHGGLGTGKFIQKQSKMDEVADANGFLAVYPDGLYRTWNAGGCCERAMRENIDDVGFVRAMIARLEADYNVDSRRIYATGFSNGSMFVHRLACELSDKIAAIAPVSGVIMVSECRPQSPMPIMVFHGTEDPRSLWEGGLGDKSPEKGVRDSLPVTIRKLTSRYHCAGRAETTYQKGAVSCETHAPCDAGVEVTLCRIAGGGHQWPGGEPVWPKKLGPMNNDISASALMWSFFRAHPMPAARGRETPGVPDSARKRPISGDSEVEEMRPVVLP